jgi:hypothetical protein
MKGIRISFTTFIFTLMTVFTAGNVYADGDNDLARFVDERESALVTVKYVLAINMGNQAGNIENESENQLTCTMISGDGLLVCSNNQMTGFMNLIKRFTRKAGGEITATPRDLKVLIGEQDDSYDAEIVAKDTELDIVWVKITTAGEHSFSFIEFSGDTQTGIGQPVLIIRRLGDSFGRTPVISRSLIGGISSKPRNLYIPEKPIVNGAGLPVFSADGQPIGLVVTQLPEAGDNMNPATAMLGADMANLQDAMSGLILPASDVVKATRRALETVESRQ